MNDFAIKVLTAPLGKTHIFSTGQAGYIIKSASGQLLGIDLYLSDCVERVEGNVGFKRLLPRILNPYELTFDVVIATHPHRDHFDIDSIPELMSGDKVHLFASVGCRELIRRIEMSEKNVAYVQPGDSSRIGDFHIYFINCDHGKGAADAVGVIITVDGKNIVEVGDTCLRLDRVDEYKSQGDIDVLIAPINGAYGNLNENECARLADKVEANITIPCHYGMFASHGGDPGRFYQIMTEEYPENRFLLMAQGEKYTL